MKQITILIPASRSLLRPSSRMILISAQQKNCLPYQEWNLALLSSKSFLISWDIHIGNWRIWKLLNIVSLIKTDLFFYASYRWVCTTSISFGSKRILRWWEGSPVRRASRMLNRTLLNGVCIGRGACSNNRRERAVDGMCVRVHIHILYVGDAI